VQIWTSYVTAFESYRLTDRQTYRHDRNYHAASRVDRGQPDAFPAEMLNEAKYWGRGQMLKYEIKLHIKRIT